MDNISHDSGPQGLGRLSAASTSHPAKLKNSMHQYTIDDLIEFPLQTSVEVTIAFPTGKRWLFFVTPELLSRAGDTVDGSIARVHLGELHMIIVSELSAGIIDSVLRDLYQDGELERRTVPISSDGES